MEYRKLPHGDEHERLSVLGLGFGNMAKTPADEVEQIVRTAIDHDINFFDLCAGAKHVYAPFGRAIAGRREQVFFQLHFGATYNEKGDYGWSRDLKTIQDTFAWELEALGTDYIDFGFLHCVDEQSDWDDLQASGVFDFLKELRAKGVVRHIGLSSHTPSVTHKVLDTGVIDMVMFSLNPAYDLEKGDEYGIGSVAERAALFRRCESEGVGISVMKPFHGGQLLDAATSPFRRALSRYACLQYALDRPGVLTTVPGVRSMDDLQELLGFADADADEKDYSVIGEFTPDAAVGNCVYCNHCQPCPAGINVGLVNKYYDLAMAGDRLAANHYEKLEIKADACLHCGHCDRRCPFGVQQSRRMTEIAAYFG